jgi:hypothetical protein
MMIYDGLVIFSLYSLVLLVYKISGGLHKKHGWISNPIIMIVVFDAGLESGLGFSCLVIVIDIDTIFL